MMASAVALTPIRIEIGAGVDIRAGHGYLRLISRQEEGHMIALWVKVRVKPEARERFLKAIEVDALGSEGDEPGCMRFNVLQDQQDQNVYYFYEVYRDEAAIEAHRAAPHYAVWRAAADTLDGPAQATRCQTVFPAAAEYWSRNK
jgi:(4S)-4-hydroxy-5-phosphonooxypentane-2,3-dione isomerase